MSVSQDASSTEGAKGANYGIRRRLWRVVGNHTPRATKGRAVASLADGHHVTALPTGP